MIELKSSELYGHSDVVDGLIDVLRNAQANAEAAGLPSPSVFCLADDVARARLRSALKGAIGQHGLQVQDVSIDGCCLSEEDSGEDDYEFFSQVLIAHDDPKHKAKAEQEHEPKHKPEPEPEDEPGEEESEPEHPEKEPEPEAKPHHKEHPVHKHDKPKKK